MTHLIHIHADSIQSRLKKTLSQVAQTTLDELNAPPCELTVVLTDENQIRELNRQYSGIDQATDVLAFPNESPDPDTGLIYKGDVVIAQSIAERQAQSSGHTLEAELALLIVHGILHLFDYDHATVDDKEDMWQMQRKILLGLNLPVNEMGGTSA